jgi:hypothetical protein
VAVASMQSSISSTPEGSNTTKEDVPSGLSSTKTQTQTAEPHGDFSSMSASHYVTCFVQRCLMTSSR